MRLGCYRLKALIISLSIQFLTHASTLYAVGVCVYLMVMDVAVNLSRLKEVHLLRGMDFENAGDRSCMLHPEAIAELKAFDPCRTIVAEGPTVNPWTEIRDQSLHCKYLQYSSESPGVNYTFRLLQIY